MQKVAVFLWLVAVELSLFLCMVSGEARKRDEATWALDVRGSYGTLDGTWSDEIDPGEARAADRVYFLPDADELGRLIGRLKLPAEYKAEIFDCDDFAYWFRAELERQWAAGGAVAPLAIGVVFVRVQDAEKEFGHGFNTIVVSGGRLILIEPQTLGPLGKHIKVLKVMSFWI